MKRIGIVAAVLLVVAVTIGFFLKKGKTEDVTYRFVTVTKGDLEATVSATGKLSAVRTVQVGTQVSGQLAGIYVDFNDHVKKGQVLARIDPTVLQQQVRQAEADIERVKADVAQKKYELDQNTPLFQQKVITESEYNTSKYNYTVALSNLKSSQAALERAQQNLNYSTIYSPIDGIVVERDVEPGQTVAASMSTPQLFLLAEDLKNMQILVNVDESDIGSIKEGMAVHFNVQAYPERTFEGTVQQVRLQSAATDNVVNYTVVVRVNNDDGVLLPGMTATVAFEVQKVEDVLKVPAAALRFKPTQEMLVAVGMDSASRAKRLDSLKAAGVNPNAMGGPSADGGAVAAPNAQSPNGAPTAAAPNAGAQSGAAANGQRGQNAVAQNGAGNANGQRGGEPGGAAQPGAGFAANGRAGGGARRNGGGGMLWYLDEAGKLKIMRVRTGITNGQETVVMGKDLKEGMQIIAGVSGGTEATSTANPFQGQPQGRGGPGNFGRGF
jgi:HlyD family secretion protein